MSISTSIEIALDTGDDQLIALDDALDPACRGGSPTPPDW